MTTRALLSAGQTRVAKRLERIGDYVTDICEQIVYMKEATVIKHRRLNN